MRGITQGAPIERSGHATHGSYYLPVLLLPRVGHVPDRPRPVIGNKQRSVFTHSNAHRPSPNPAVAFRKTSEKILVLTGGVTVLHR